VSLLRECPDPKGWSVVTLAEELCVAPAEVDRRLTPLVEGDREVRDLVAPRWFGSYLNAAGEALGDAYLTREAAERIARDVPAGLVARAVLARGHTHPHAEDTATYQMARHIVAHAGRVGVDV